jgi:hypothetical protein
VNARVTLNLLDSLRVMELTRSLLFTSTNDACAKRDASDADERDAVEFVA